MGIKFKGKGELLLLFLLFFFIYLAFQLKSIYGGDSGDLVTAAWVWGLAHPPGYPFYTLLGAILSHLINFSTPAWRVGLISSFSSSLTLTVFYLFLKKLSQNKWASLLAAFFLAFLYPFWLYTEVAEVFALNNLFAILLVYLFFSFYSAKNKKQAKIELSLVKKYALAFFFVLGLSLAHHHTIVLILPGFIYLWLKNKPRIKPKKRQLILWLTAFLLGLSFYIYAPLACRLSPLVCWDDPVNLPNFIRLITRADYGTFLASLGIANEPVLRVYSLLSGLKLTLVDFQLFGIALVIAGLYFSFKKNNHFLKFSLISLACFFFFLFYASWVLVNDFMVATFERFLIMPYVLLSLLLGMGLTFIFQIINKLVKKLNFSLTSEKILIYGINILFILLPMSVFSSNYKKISILKNDMTAENMAKDLLTPLPLNSILIVTSDTTIFDLQYVRYVLNFRKDVIVLAYPVMPAPYYQKIIKENFPDLILSKDFDVEKNLEEFVKANKDKYFIFVDGHTFEPQENWLPYGLAWQYLEKDKQPEVSKIKDDNLFIWQNFNNPLEGSLKQFENLFLTDILRIYKQGRINIADYLLEKNYLDEAYNFYELAKPLNKKNEEPIIGQGAVMLKKKECDKAKGLFTKALEINKDSVLAMGYLRKTYLECYQNEEEAKKYEEQCIQTQEGQSPVLENLGK